MSFKSNVAITLLCTTSTLALVTMARAQESTESVTVTGSRVISDAINSPTPLTVLDVGQLQATTPSNIADGLNKLPAFIGSQSSRSVNNASTDTAANVLNLRSFGSQ